MVPLLLPRREQAYLLSQFGPPSKTTQADPGPVIASQSASLLHMRHCEPDPLKFSTLAQKLALPVVVWQRASAPGKPHLLSSTLAVQ